jgi:predicted protein tyrosine phosphatase
MAEVLSQEPYNFNTRACGFVTDYALIPLDDVLLHWADEIVVVNEEIGSKIALKTKKPIINLDIKDEYEFRHPKLVELIKERYDECQKCATK